MPPRGTPIVEEAEKVPEVVSIMPVEAEKSAPVPPNPAPIAVPFQVP